MAQNLEMEILDTSHMEICPPCLIKALYRCAVNPAKDPVGFYSAYLSPLPFDDIQTLFEKIFGLKHVDAIQVRCADHNPFHLKGSQGHDDTGD